MNIILKTLEETQDFVEKLAEEEKWAVTVAQKADDQFLIQWTEHKFYTAHDGQQFRDEVWITEAGDMKLIQDIELEHARNIIRMMIRNERKRDYEIAELTEKMVGSLSELEKSFNAALNTSTDPTPDTEPRVLH